MRLATYYRFRAFLFGISICTLLPVVSFGQVSNPYYVGTVYDNHTQKPLQGVSIQVLNVDSSKALFNVRTNTEGSYSLPLPRRSNIKITAALRGYISKEVSYGPGQLENLNGTIPPIYLDTSIKITPTQPVPQTREQFMVQKLMDIDVLPSPSAYRLLYYLNPGLEEKGSLMSNEKIVLPIMPPVSKDLKSANKRNFENAKSTDKSGRRALADSLENLYRFVSEISDNNRINYSGVSSDNVKQMRTFLQLDINNIREKVNSFIKLQSDEMTVLISSLSKQFRIISRTSRFSRDDYEKIKALWLDLYYMFQGSLYRNFLARTNDPDLQEFGSIINVNPDINESGPALHSLDNNYGQSDADYIYIEPRTILNETGVAGDKLALFGFVIWAKNITTYNDLNTPLLQDRYIVRYFKPSKIDDTTSYIMSSPRANVALANLGNARYGVQVYDQKEKKYLELFDPFFRTTERFTNRRYDNIFIRDYKDVVIVVIELK